MHTAFHFAFHVRDLDQSRAFYTDILGCTEGRSTATWVDFDFFGHQLSLHLGESFPVTQTGQVDEIAVPMPHFGVAMPMGNWKRLSERLIDYDVKFLLAPTIRFKGMPGEQATMFFFDPSGNPIEIKGFTDMGTVYSTE